MANNAQAIDSLTSDDTKPWYRHGWLWFLISFPLVSVVLGGVMLFLAFSANNSLVVDDYYKEGKAYNLRIERDRVASLLGLTAAIVQNEEGLVLDLNRSPPASLPVSLQEAAAVAESRFTMPQSLALRWVHVTQEQRDGDTEMTYIGQNRYVAPDVQLPEQGKYRLHIAPVRTALTPQVLPNATQDASSKVASSGGIDAKNATDALALGDDWRLISWLMSFESSVTIDVVAPELEAVFTRSMLE